MTQRPTVLTRAAFAGASLAAILGLLVLGAPGRSASAEPPTLAPVATPSPAPQDGFGTIKGRLVWGGSEIPKPEPITQNKEKDPQVCAKEPLFKRDLVVDPDTKGVANAFAYLPAPKGKNPGREAEYLKEHPKVEIDQVNCQFVPYASAGMSKQEWLFKSSDAVGHNVHYTGFLNNANFALGPNGEATKSLNPDKRPTPLTCDIHPWMQGYLLIVDHPFFAVTAKDGSFEIQGVPAGTQGLVVWLPSGFVTEGGLKGKPVKVEAGKTTDLGEIVLKPEQVKGK
jgi:hypothetical protein